MAGTYINPKNSIVKQKNSANPNVKTGKSNVQNAPSQWAKTWSFLNVKSKNCSFFYSMFGSVSTIQSLERIPWRPRKKSKKFKIPVHISLEKKKNEKAELKHSSEIIEKRNLVFIQNVKCTLTISIHGDWLLHNEHFGNAFFCGTFSENFLGKQHTARFTLLQIPYHLSSGEIVRFEGIII
uniref:Uncharacterized protein n=1 Tax=Caenorhabditis japonica TaxID=281687 RepID=A0A8R1E6W7_CAEJA